MNGWFRYGHWAAHLYVDGEQACNTRHGEFPDLAIGARRPPSKLLPADLTPLGWPYGKVCARCATVAHKNRAPPTRQRRG